MHGRAREPVAAHAAIGCQLDTQPGAVVGPCEQHLNGGRSEKTRAWRAFAWRTVACTPRARLVFQIGAHQRIGGEAQLFIPGRRVETVFGGQPAGTRDGRGAVEIDALFGTARHACVRPIAERRHERRAHEHKRQ
jgi:hypothetical protein